jgi:hypothetical protein
MLPTSALTIRPASDADAASIRRLALLDSGPVPTGRVLVAEENGTVVAALSADHGAVLADPFEPTAEAVALLRARVASLHALTRRPSWRERVAVRLRGPRLRHVAAA